MEAFEESEKENFLQFFNKYNLDCEFYPMLTTDTGTFWGGAIRNRFQWLYSVLDYEQIFRVDFKYINDFNPEDPENKKLISDVHEHFQSYLSRLKYG